jgi:hypothetical protein
VTRRQVIEALGIFPLLPIVWMRGQDCAQSGHVIASGVLQSAEPSDGTYYHVNEQLVLMLKPASIPSAIVRTMTGKGVEIVVRELPAKPTLERLKR